MARVKKIIIILNTKRVSCGGSMSPLGIRHEKNKVDTFDPKAFREKLEGKK